MSTIASEGGFDIPAGINPVAQLHDLEEIWPREYADAVRAMAPNGVGGGSITIHISAIDMKGSGACKVLRNMAIKSVPVTR